MRQNVDKDEGKSKSKEKNKGKIDTKLIPQFEPVCEVEYMSIADLAALRGECVIGGVPEEDTQ